MIIYCLPIRSDFREEYEDQERYEYHISGPIES